MACEKGNIQTYRKRDQAIKEKEKPGRNDPENEFTFRSEAD
jgi:hypothetical protein